jgi:hypothetical protein
MNKNKHPAQDGNKCMEKKRFEIWENNGIPCDKPEFTCDTLQEVRNYIEDDVYEQNGKICSQEGCEVYFDGEKISLDAIFSRDDFYSSKEWSKSCMD